MRYWCRLVAFWLLLDALLLALAPARVAAFVAFRHYLGAEPGHALRLLILGAFTVTALACFIASWLPYPVMSYALSLAFTVTLIWSAVGALVAITGFGDYGRLTLYLIWLYVQAERLRYAWVTPPDERQVRNLIASLKKQRRELERRQDNA